MAIFIRKVCDMIEDFKSLIMIAITAVLTAIIRYKGFFAAITDGIIGFLMGWFSWLMLTHFVESDALRNGITGMIVIYATPLYHWINDFIKHKLSDVITNKINRR